jgi:phospholipase D-like protein
MAASPSPSGVAKRAGTVSCWCETHHPVDQTQILLLLTPVLLVQLGLLVVALRDLLRPERRVRGGNKLVWGVIIVLVNIVGPILYFAVGREED